MRVLPRDGRGLQPTEAYVEQRAHLYARASPRVVRAARHRMSHSRTGHPVCRSGPARWALVACGLGSGKVSAHPWAGGLPRLRCLQRIGAPGHS